MAPPVYSALLFIKFQEMHLLGCICLIILHYIFSNMFRLLAIIKKLQIETLFKIYEYPLTFASSQDRIRASAVRDLQHQCTFDLIIQFVLRREHSVHPTGHQRSKTV